MEHQPIPIDKSNIVAYADHKNRVVSASGINGNPIYNPYTQDMLKSWAWPSEDYLQAYELSLNETGWKRSWGILSGNTVIGSLDLSNQRTIACQHRCLLMMGVDDAEKGKGLGKELVSFALSWAKDTEIEWVDLEVFETNIPALSLYKKFNFKEIGHTEDAFRISNQSITNISMTVNLHQP